MGRLEGSIVIKDVKNDVVNDVKNDDKNDDKNDVKNDVKNDLVNDLVNDVKDDVVNEVIKDETRKIVMDSFRDHSYGKYKQTNDNNSKIYSLRTMIWSSWSV
jgi:hypothetical protein